MSSDTTGYRINHIAVSVPDCDAAVKWYTDTLGFQKIRQDSILDRQADPNLDVFKIYDGALQKVKVAYLKMGNQVGFEVFEFEKPKYDGPTSPTEFTQENYTKGGFFHVAVTVPDPIQLSNKVAATGGKKIGEPVHRRGEVAVYMQDPWGNVVEALSCGFEQFITGRVE